MKKGVFWTLMAVFAIVLFLRLYFALQTPYYSSDTSYFHLRQIESIEKTGLPFFNDELSYSGRTFVFSPVYDYFVGALGLLFPLAAKIIPCILEAMLVFAVYLLSKRITNDDFVSVYSAIVSGFVPGLYSETFNTLSTASLAVPLIFFLIYCFQLVREKKLVNTYPVLVALLSFISPLAVLFMLGLLLYALLAKIRGARLERSETETIFFTTFLVLWSQFVLYKKLFLAHGYSVIWQNIPSEILSNYFARITLPEAVYHIGVVPFLAGLFVLYTCLFRDKSKDAMVLSGFAASAGMLLWLRMIPLTLGLLILGLLLTVLFAKWLKNSLSYISLTRGAALKNSFLILVSIALLASSLAPSAANANNAIKSSFASTDYSAMSWLAENATEGETVLAPADQGNHLAYFAGKKNVLDKNFLYREDAQERYSDVLRIYSTVSEVEALDLMNKYNVSYMFIPADAGKTFGQLAASYVTDLNCFELKYNSSAKIYRLKKYCRVKTLK